MQESIYDPGIVAFGGGSTTSVLHPLVLTAIIVIAILTFTLKRKYIIVPLLLGILLIPYTQNLYVGGYHLYMTRILILLGCTRVGVSRMFSSEKLLPGGFNILDKLFIVWACYRALAMILLFGEMGAVISSVGFLWDALGGYFLFRSLIQGEEEIFRVVKVFAVVAVIAAVGMIYEHVKLQNLFAFLGGVSIAPEIRDGRIRAEAFFGHALLAGAFGATTFCLFLWLWKQGKARLLALAGMFASMIMVYAASTSTPLIAFMCGIVALCLWPIRDSMWMLRWGMVSVLVGLDLVMKAPVWFLLGHIDLVGGSSGYHRAMLIDNFVRHFGDWWLIGTNNYMNWGWDMWDQANQYILEGEHGGLVGILCFLAMFYICYRWIGNARKAVKGDRRKEWLFWILGAAFFAQTMAFIGVDYFDQTKFVWYMFLVMVTVSTQFSRDAVASEEPVLTGAKEGEILRPWERLPAHRSMSPSDAVRPLDKWKLRPHKS